MVRGSLEARDFLRGTVRGDREGISELQVPYRAIGTQGGRQLEGLRRFHPSGDFRQLPEESRSARGYRILSLRSADDDRRDDQNARQSGRPGREHHVRQFRCIRADSYRICRKAGRRGRVRLRRPALRDILRGRNGRPVFSAFSRIGRMGGLRRFRCGFARARRKGARFACRLF